MLCRNNRRQESRKDGAVLEKVSRRIAKWQQAGTISITVLGCGLRQHFQVRYYVDGWCDGKIPANIEFGSAADEVQDIGVWGNDQDDGLVGLKARLNHAQTLYGRYGLWLTAAADDQKQNPKFIIKEYTCFQIIDGQLYTSPFDRKKQLRWIKLDENKPVFDYKSKQWTLGRRWRILGLDQEHRYYSAVMDGEGIERIYHCSLHIFHNFYSSFFVFLFVVTSMPSTYSLDLRIRVLNDCLAGLACTHIARKYSVSRIWVHNLKKQYKETGSIEPKKYKRGQKQKGSLSEFMGEREPCC